MTLPSACQEPTPHLRFVQRDGRFILQQWWVTQTAVTWARHMDIAGYQHALTWEGWWKDVPLEKEGG